MENQYIVREGDGIQVHGNNLRFLRCKDPECVCAGPADTGKTFALCLKVHLCACKYAGASIALVRKTQTSCYNTVIRTFTEKILGPNVHEWPCIPYGGLNRPERFNYDNGSVVFVTGLDKPTRLLSAEFDLVAVSQAEEVGLTDWEILTTRVTGRAGTMPYAQVVADCNPAAPTHWIKSRAKTGYLTLINSTHQDNPELYNQETGEITEGGEQRIGRLKRLSGSRLMRLYHGLWVVPEGAIYSVFDQDKHQVSAFPIPRLWPRFAGIDPLGAYVACVWLALDPKSQILNVYREYYGAYGPPTSRHAANMLELSGYHPNGSPKGAEAENIYYWVCGQPGERQARADFQAANIPALTPAFADVWAGIDRIIDLLDNFSLVIHDSCPVLLSEIGNYRRKLDRKGQATDVIEDKGKYHMLDCLRYSIVGPAELQETSSVSYNPVQIGAQF